MCSKRFLVNADIWNHQTECAMCVLVIGLIHFSNAFFKNCVPLMQNLTLRLKVKIKFSENFIISKYHPGLLELQFESPS